MADPLTGVYCFPGQPALPETIDPDSTGHFEALAGEPIVLTRAAGGFGTTPGQVWITRANEQAVFCPPVDASSMPWWQDTRITVRIPQQSPGRAAPYTIKIFFSAKQDWQAAQQEGNFDVQIFVWGPPPEDEGRYPPYGTR